MTTTFKELYPNALENEEVLIGVYKTSRISSCCNFECKNRTYFVFFDTYETHVCSSSCISLVEGIPTSYPVKIETQVLTEPLQIDNVSLGEIQCSTPPNGTSTI